MGDQAPSRIPIRDALTSFKENTPRAVKLVFSYTPGWTIVNILLVVVLGLLPLATLYIMKLLVDTVTAGVEEGVMPGEQLILILLAAAGVALATACCRAVSSYATEIQSVVMTDRVSDLIHTKSASVDLAFYENPDYHDNLHRAQTQGPSRPGKIINDLVQIGQNCISIGAVGALILSFSPVAGFILVAAAIPAAVLRFWYSKKLYALQLEQTELERKSWYFHYVLTTIRYAKEIRLFGIGDYFREQYSILRDGIRHAKLALSRTRAVWDVVFQGIITVAVFGSFAVIAFKTLEGTITLGDMVVYFTGFQLCIGYIQTVFTSLSALYEDNLFLTNFFQFLDLEPAKKVPDNPVPLPEKIQKEIRIEDLSFTYPGRTKATLSGINMTLRAGEIIALVGENGAGKSTLIKLLTGLYVPDSGTIYVDGIPLNEIDPEEWRSRLSVVFQDFVQYYISAYDNIRLGNLNDGTGPDAVKKAARKSGADGVIDKLPHGYDTILGQYFSGGKELSTGEWQKLALARAFFRDPDIYILDEPSSSLDAISEKEIFCAFRDIIEGHSAILISHRFSTVLMADHIYVLEDGRVVENGNHSELMKNCGLYSRMFNAQADLYK